MALVLRDPRRAALAAGAAGALVNPFANAVFNRLVGQAPDAARAIARAGYRAYQRFRNQQAEPRHRRPYARPQGPRREPVRNVDRGPSHSIARSSSRSMPFRSRSRSRRPIRRRGRGRRPRLRRVSYRRLATTIGRAPRRYSRRARKAVLSRVPPLAEVKMVGRTLDYYNGGATYCPYRLWLDFPFFNVGIGTGDNQRTGKSIRGLGSTWKLTFWNSSETQSVTINIALITPKKYAPATTTGPTQPFEWWLGDHGQAATPQIMSSDMFSDVLGTQHLAASHYFTNPIYWDKSRVKVLSFQSFVLSSQHPGGSDARSPSGIPSMRKILLKQKYRPLNKVTWQDGGDPAGGTPMSASSMARFFIWLTYPSTGPAHLDPSAISTSGVFMEGFRRSYYVDL